MEYWKNKYRVKETLKNKPDVILIDKVIESSTSLSRLCSDFETKRINEVSLLEIFDFKSGRLIAYKDYGEWK